MNVHTHMCVCPSACMPAFDVLRGVQLCSMWKRFLTPRLSALLYHIRANPGIGTRDGRPVGTTRDESSPHADPSSKEVPNVRDSSTLVLYQTWCTGVLKAASALLRVCACCFRWFASPRPLVAFVPPGHALMILLWLLSCCHTSSTMCRTCCGHGEVWKMSLWNWMPL